MSYCHHFDWIQSLGSHVWAFRRGFGLFVLFIILGSYHFLRRLLVIYRRELDDIRREKEKKNHRFREDGEQTCQVMALW